MGKNVFFELRQRCDLKRTYCEDLNLNKLAKYFNFVTDVKPVEEEEEEEDEEKAAPQELEVKVVEPAEVASQVEDAHPVEEIKREEEAEVPAPVEVAPTEEVVHNTPAPVEEEVVSISADNTPAPVEAVEDAELFVTHEPESDQPKLTFESVINDQGSKL